MANIHRLTIEKYKDKNTKGMGVNHALLVLKIQ
ncbi:hypothetical protein VAA_01076 [Vibrio anguillarum 775]|nr:hypothetical protein VAA_01076 [Vibrio anguillarum 775]